MDRVILLVDSILESELKGGRIDVNSRTARLFKYMTAVLQKIKPGTVTTLLVASPKPGKCKAKEMREHSEKIQNAIAEFNPTLVAVLGKAALYPIEPYLPTAFPRNKQYQRLWGRYFPFNSESWAGQQQPRFVLCPSLSMVFANKDQEGGYLHLRTVQECITDALLQRTDRIKTVSHFVSDRRRLDELKGLWTGGSGISRKLRHSTIGFDTETTGLNIVTDRVRTVQISVADGESYVFPFELLQPSEWTQLISDLRTAGYTFVLQNGKYDSKILRSNGVELGDFEELSIAHVLVDEREGTHNLQFIGQQVLGAGKDEIATEQLINGPIDQAFISYAGRDTDVTRRAFNYLYPAVKEKSAFQTLKKAQTILSYGEHRGIRLDGERLQDLNERTKRKLSEYKGLFSDIGLNPKSVPQVRAALGLDKSDKKALEEVDSDLARAIIDYRGLIKVKSSYLDRLMASYSVDGRFHPDTRLAGPVTGRTSSGSGKVEDDQKWLPINAQNIPRPPQGQEYKYFSEELRAQLRYLFIADPGYVIVGADLAAAEMRMAANACMDPVMISDLNRKLDTHSLLTVTAFALEKKYGFTLDIEGDPKEWIKYVRPNHEHNRQSTKNATFAVLYGASDPTIASQAQCDVETAKLLRRTIYGRYTGLEPWIEGIHSKVRSTGSVSTRYGRKRIFPYSVGVFDRQQQQSMLREAQNYVIQSEASDYCLMGMIKYAENCPAKWDNWMWNFVHDAAYACVKEDYAEEATKLMVESMETADKLPAVLYAEAKYAQSWGKL